MSEEYRTAQQFGLFLYVVGAVLSVILAVSRGISSIWLIIIALFFIVSASCFKYLGKKAGNIFFGIYQGISYIMLAEIVYIVSKSIPAYFVIMSMQIILLLMYMNSRLMQINMPLILIFTFATYILSCSLMPALPPVMDYPMCIFALAGINWISVQFAKMIELKEKRSKEQEQSLDDLLNVIEVKCDDARAATRSKSEFLSNMSHEIRTPLNSILGMNEMILRECDDDNIREYAANAETSGRLLLSLINDILDFSKIESGKMDIIPVQYQLSSLINDTVNMLQRRFDDKGLKLIVDVDPDTPEYLFGDEVRIRQVLTNIMTNALKYTDKGSVTVTVGFEHNKKEENMIALLMCVKDTGRGIKPEDKDKLFTSFSRIDQERNRNIEGTGLGLSITSYFVNAMGGSIGVASVYGEGSEFRVRIPQKVVQNEPVGNLSARFIEGRNHEEYSTSFIAPEARVLVTDDNIPNLVVVKGLLKHTKIKLEMAKSGMECLEKLRSDRFDVILLDHMMPEMDGIETLKRIRSEKLAEGVPVIALTANAVSGAREMYLGYGFEDYLSKPIAGSSLERLLMKYLPKELIREQEITAPSAVKSEKPEGEPVTDENDITYIDKAIGMNYCGGSFELYAMMIQAFLDQCDENRSKLKMFFDEKDIENYRIAAHTVKTNTLNIGAAKMSEQAKQHEYAARDNDIDFIQKDFESFYTNFGLVNEAARRLLEQI